MDHHRVSALGPVDELDPAEVAGRFAPDDLSDGFGYVVPESPR
jgi:hypothetical protein